MSPAIHLIDNPYNQLHSKDKHSIDNKLIRLYNYKQIDYA